MNARLPDHLLNATQALHAAFLSPHETQETIGEEHRFPVIWDSGTSISISPNKSDFVGPPKSAPIDIRLQGIAKGLNINGSGHIAWSFVDNKGMLQTLKVPAYFVPAAAVCLLSTTSLLQELKSESIQQLPDCLCLSGNQET